MIDVTVVKIPLKQKPNSVVKLQEYRLQTPEKSALVVVVVVVVVKRKNGTRNVQLCSVCGCTAEVTHAVLLVVRVSCRHDEATRVDHIRDSKPVVPDHWPDRSASHGLRHRLQFSENMSFAFMRCAADAVAPL